jgi:hypothetical protein
MKGARLFDVFVSEARVKIRFASLTRRVTRRMLLNQQADYASGSLESTSDWETPHISNPRVASLSE